MSSPNIQRQGSPRGGAPMRGAPRGSPRGAPRGGMYRGGPPRGGSPRGRGNFGGNNVVREAPPSTVRTFIYITLYCFSQKELCRFSMSEKKIDKGNNNRVRLELKSR